MRVLVTGATSLLGAALAAALSARGDEVSVLQRRPSGLPVREVLADIADARAVAAAAAGQEAVVHLAAKVGVGGRRQDYERVNVGGTRALLTACRQAGVRRLVHVSSPSVAHAGRALVGAGAGPADPGAARGGYARTKATAELLALGADGGPAGLSVLVVRPHLVWGPGDTQLVGPIVERARSGRLAVIGSGAALVDSTYLPNAVDALLAALDRAEAAHGQALVVSNGEPWPVGELIARITMAAGSAPPRLHVAPTLAWLAGAVAEGAWAVLHREGDPPMTRFLAEQLSTAHWFDQRHTRAVLGWAPRVTVEAGLTQLAAFHAGGGAATG